MSLPRNLHPEAHTVYIEIYEMCLVILLLICWLVLCVCCPLLTEGHCTVTMEVEEEAFVCHKPYSKVKLFFHISQLVRTLGSDCRVSIDGAPLEDCDQGPNSGSLVVLGLEPPHLLINIPELKALSHHWPQ